MLRDFFIREEGQSLVEYALVLVLIAMAVIGTLAILGVNIGGVFEDIADAFPN